jgi:two-component system phosphate regulon sensor histidine kinase PhoR
MTETATTVRRSSIGLRIFGVTFSLLLATLIVVYGYARTQVQRELTASISSDLAARLGLVAERVSVAGKTADSSIDWDKLADELGALSGARVTLVRRDGKVLGDSNVSAADLAGVENHASRPEIASVLGGGMSTSESQRFSKTVGEAMLYRGVIWKVGSEVEGVVRLSVPLTKLHDAEARLTWSLSFGVILVLLASLAVAAVAAQLGSRAAKELTEVAGRMRLGDLTARSAFTGTDEFAVLGRTLNGLAENLSATLEQLRAEKGLLDRVLSSMREGVIVLDSSAAIVLSNSALLEMFSLKQAIEGKAASEVFNHPEFIEMLSTAIAGQSNSRELVFPGAAPKVLLANVRRLPPKGAVAVLVDITAQRRLETVRQEFVANASHELRTPIATITSAVETLQDAAANEPEAAANFLAMIERNAQRLKVLVDDLLSLSLLESGRMEVRLESIELVGAVDSTLLSLESAATKKQTELVNLVQPDVWVNASLRGLEHVLLNLVDNAIKYCPAGSRVVVEAKEMDDRVDVFVTDNGPGIPEPHRERIFERFYRVDTGRSRSLGGTGLGLSIVKHWVEAMSGSISLTSPGEGSRFRVVLRRGV